MPQVTVRRADALDIPFLQEANRKTNWEHVDLRRSLVWVAEYDGTPFMYAALRLIWQIEPIQKFRTKGIPKSAQRRGMYLLYKAIEDHLFTEKNQTGIAFVFAHTFSKRVYRWAKAMGWHRCYKGGFMAVKWFGSEKHRCKGDCCKDKEQ